MNRQQAIRDIHDAEERGFAIGRHLGGGVWIYLDVYYAMGWGTAANRIWKVIE